MSEKDSSSEGQSKVDPWTASPEEAAAKPVSGQAGEKPQDWERNLINRLAFAALNEQRRARRWSIFFKSLLFIYLFFLLLLLLPKKGADISAGDHTAMVQIEGAITADGPASADIVNSGLRAAFENKNAKGIILRINSPGGSAVQAGYVYDEIRRLKQEHPDIRVYAVVSDICASAAYYIASAADEVYANRASLVGSIGVLVDSFGFVEAMKKLGIERRLLTAGAHKGFLDPFSPLAEGDKRHMEGVLQNAYKQFVSAVKEGRGDRLKDDPRVLTGLIWTGEQGVELGLVDGLGSAGYVARELVHAEEIVDYTPRRSILDRFAERVGAATASALSSLLIGPNGVR